MILPARAVALRFLAGGLAAILLTASCSGGPDRSYENAVEAIMDELGERLAPAGAQDPPEPEELLRIFEEAIDDLDSATPPERYEEGHDLLRQYFEKNVELYALFLEFEGGVGEGDRRKFQVEYERLFIEAEQLLEAAGREMPFLGVEPLGDLETTDPDSIPDLRSAEITYRVELREGGSVDVEVTYRLPDGSDQTATVTTPWESEPLLFETGSTIRFRAIASTSPPSHLDCLIAAVDPSQGVYSYGPQGDLPETECFGEYELGLWPPDDDDPINNPLIRVG